MVGLLLRFCGTVWQAATFLLSRGTSRSLKTCCSSQSFSPRGASSPSCRLPWSVRKSSVCLQLRYHQVFQSCLLFQVFYSSLLPFNLPVFCFYHRIPLSVKSGRPSCCFTTLLSSSDMNFKDFFTSSISSDSFLDVSFHRWKLFKKFISEGTEDFEVPGNPVMLTTELMSWKTPKT